MKVLDLQNLDTCQTIQLNKIAQESRKQYVEYVDQLSKDRKGEFAWWLTGLATRNSEYFAEQMYKFLLVKNMLQNYSEIEEIRVGDIGLYRVLKKYVRKHNIKGVTIVRPAKSLKQSFVGRLLMFFYVWFIKVREYIIIQKECKISQQLNSIDLLIDTYVLNSCFNQEGKYMDRYFEGILNYISGEIWFSTILVPNIKESFKKFIAKIINEKEYGFLIKEKFLKPIDYIRMLSYPLYCITLLTSRFCFYEDDVTSIFRRGIILDISNINTLDGYIAYFFVKRIKERNINVKDVILWYEGQPVTMGIVMGMKKYYSQVPLKGFLEVALLENTLNLFPSTEQVKQDMSPSKLGVMGRALVDEVKLFCEEMEVDVFPAFRYYSRRQTLKEKLSRNGWNILVVLPGIKTVAKELLIELARALSVMENRENYHIFIKNHPQNAEYTIADYECDLNINAEIVDGEVTSLLNEMNIAINSMSSSGMEIIAKEVYLITYVPCGALANIGIPRDVSNELYRVAYTAEDICQGLKEGIYIREQEKKIAMNVLHYFEPVNQQSVGRMVL